MEVSNARFQQPSKQTGATMFDSATQHPIQSILKQNHLAQSIDALACCIIQAKMGFDRLALFL